MQKVVDLDQVALTRLQRLGGVQLLRQMLDLFLQHASARIEAAQAAHREGNCRGVEQAVHSLKSSAGNIGARTIQNLTEALECMAEKSQSEQIGSLLLDLQIAWERLEPLLRQTIEGIDHETNRDRGGQPGQPTPRPSHPGGSV